MTKTPAAACTAAGAPSALAPRGEAPGLPHGQWVFARQEPEGDRDLTPARDAELLAEDVAVRLGGPGGDPEPCSDLFVRAPGCDESDDLALALGDRRLFPLRGQVDHG